MTSDNIILGRLGSESSISNSVDDKHDGRLRGARLVHLFSNTPVSFAIVSRLFAQRSAPCRLYRTARARRAPRKSVFFKSHTSPQCRHVRRGLHEVFLTHFPIALRIASSNYATSTRHARRMSAE